MGKKINIFEKIKKTIKVSESGCWEWQGSLDNGGYGTVRYMGKTHKAHRVVYRLFIGEIPSDYRKFYICHKCDNPKCVSPFHLFLGTSKENNLDAQIKGRSRIAVHGTTSMYYNRLCRCEVCVKANSDYKKAWYQKKKLNK